MLQTNTDDLYWEQDEPETNQVISDLEPQQENITDTEEGTTVPGTIRPKKVISRNVSNSQRRRFR